MVVMMVLGKAEEFKDNVYLVGRKGSIKNLAAVWHNFPLSGVKPEEDKAASQPQASGDALHYHCPRSFLPLIQAFLIPFPMFHQPPKRASLSVPKEFRKLVF